MELNLFEKTELWINGIQLSNVNLNEIARTASEVLGLQSDDVLVVDVRDTHITLDILQSQIRADAIYGKKKELLGRLAQIRGISIFEDTEVHSEGILGMIGLEENEVPGLLENTRNMAEEIKMRISKRAIVFPTGFEVKNKMIEDTNTPLIVRMLKDRGYQAQAGEAVDDDLLLIAGKIRSAVQNGYGLVITTGGVGAEDKDQTVEAILKLDPQAATPYISKFQKGTGRHEKDGVRIAAAIVDTALVIALPGPNDEVRIGMDAVVEGIERGLGKEGLASRLAEALRGNLEMKMKQKQAHDCKYGHEDKHGRQNQHQHGHGRQSE